jgi:hypothetical protein
MITAINGESKQLDGRGKKGLGIDYRSGLCTEKIRRDSLR